MIRELNLQNWKNLIEYFEGLKVFLTTAFQIISIESRLILFCRKIFESSKHSNIKIKVPLISYMIIKKSKIEYYLHFNIQTLLPIIKYLFLHTFI